MLQTQFFLTVLQVAYFITEFHDAWEIPRDEVEIGSKLGHGSYGDVFKGQLKMTAMSPKIYAHKQEMEFEGRSHHSIAVKMLRRKLTQLGRHIISASRAILLYIKRSFLDNQYYFHPNKFV